MQQLSRRFLQLSLIISAVAGMSYTFAYAIYCPVSLTCNYSKGSCDYNKDEGWSANTGGVMPFDGDQIFNLYRITGLKVGEGDYSHYIYSCNYRFANSDISLHQMQAKNLVGNGWQYSGFGSKQAECTKVSHTKLSYDCGAEFSNPVAKFSYDDINAYLETNAAIMKSRNDSIKIKTSNE